MIQIAFRVHGIPKGQPRPRAFAVKVAGKVTARMYDSGTAEGWKGAIAAAAQPHLPAAPIQSPVRLFIDFFIARPKRLCRKNDDPGILPAVCKPDVDNFAKAVMDALTGIGMWADDALVVELHATKHYHGLDQRPGAYVRIFEVVG